ncbi:unnamed protein product [Schistosoma curassoni]|uniref:Tectonic domain-containing protein n=1 Tax=Schistosoma curassoni TaxID=6186 RepID=A0A183K1M8_9TREM|nr:unnamed protein product [Schistosoma curassoni]
MCIYFNLNLILLLFLITFNLLSNSFLSLCSNLPKSTKLTTSLNTLNQFKHCCDDGLIAAHSLDLPILTSQTSVTNTETCAEILQFGTSVVEDVSYLYVRIFYIITIQNNGETIIYGRPLSDVKVTLRVFT